MRNSTMQRPSINADQDIESVHNERDFSAYPSTDHNNSFRLANMTQATPIKISSMNGSNLKSTSSISNENYMSLSQKQAELCEIKKESEQILK